MSTTASRRPLPEILTAPPEVRRPVPHHLLDTETFSKVAKNDVVAASPSVIHFGGFQVGRSHVQKLDLINCSSEVQRYHVVPPQTPFFKIKYTKGDRLIPGMALRVEVTFVPDEWRYFYDCVRIHCRGNDHLIIPIHAYPTIDDGAIPKNFTFPPTPIGVQQTKVVPLRSPHPVSFEFRVSILEGNPAFAIQPMEGIVPPKGEARINVIFTPIAFVTVSMKMMIETSQFNSKPQVCVFSGMCRPGLGAVDADTSNKRQTEICSTLDPREIKPLDVSRTRRQLTKLNRVAFQTGKGRLPSIAGSESTASETEKDGVLFPKDLNNPQAVSYVLNQRPGRMTAKQLRDVISQASSRRKSAKASRARKEALFVVKTNDLLAEERANQLRWMTKLGEEAMSPRSKEEVTEDRQAGLEIYKQKRGDPLVEDEVGRNLSTCEYKRIKRGVTRPESKKRPSTQGSAMADEVGPAFDHYRNEPWRLKNRALFLFNQAARKVLIQNRADRNLAKMRRFKEAWKAGRWSVENVSLTSAPGEELPTPPISAGGLEIAMGEGFLQTGKDESKNECVLTDLEDVEKATEIIETQVEKLVPQVVESQVIRTSAFPEYVPPDFVDDMSGEALGYIPYRITEVEVHSQTPYFNLKVPQQCRIQSYGRHSGQNAAVGYVAPERRRLRNGATEEVAATVRTAKTDTIQGPKFEPKTISVDLLKMPEILKDFKYPPIEVFNPAPGLIRYRKPLPYAETDLDYHLNPIPPHVCRHDVSTASPHCATQKAFLDADDVIPGLMTWKKYARHGLATTIQIPGISSVWVPRWTDPFVDDVVPKTGPFMVEPPSSNAEAPEEDATAVATDGGKLSKPKISTLSITMDSIRTQFPLVPEVDIAHAPSSLFDSQLHLTSGASGAPGDASQMAGAAAGASLTDLQDSGANFPYSRSLPNSYIPLASSGGLISRDQRERELNIFVLSKYNQLGRRVDERQETMNALLTDARLQLQRPEKPKQKLGDEAEAEGEDAFKPVVETPTVLTGAAASRASFGS